VQRRAGASVRLKLTLSYAGFLMVAGALLLAAVWLFLLRGRPGGPVVPTLSDLRLVLTPGNAGPRIFYPAAAIVLIFLLAFGLLGGWVLAGRMLAPLTRITAATREATNGSLSHRIGLPGRTDEFRDLADAFDLMLARLEAQIGEQRRFAANASHELRTPLAIAKIVLDVARADPAHDSIDVLDRLHAVITRAIDLTEALLVLSHADQRSFIRQDVDLSLLAEEATETLLPEAERRGVSIETCAGLTPTTGSAALLLQLTMNLVQNAIVHNRPEHGQVWVSTRVGPSTVLLTVENTGPVLSDQLVSTLTEPFQRGTGRVHTDHGGVGLGLAIVRSITQAHDGALSLAARPDGGIHVTVELPAAPAPATGGSDRALSVRTSGPDDD
jgi:two-component system sensor histidine kinase VanS